MRLAREELETRKEQERQEKQQKEHPESEKKRPILSIELPEILKGKNPTPTILHTSPQATKGGTNDQRSNTKKESEINTGKEETLMLPRPTKEESCCVMCYKDVSCLIL